MIPQFYVKSAFTYLGYKLGKFSPFLMIVSPTNRCNLRCSYCTHKVSGKNMSLDVLLRVIDESVRLGTAVVSFSGGEPLMYPYIIDAAEYAKKKGLVTNLNTNGTLINKHNAQMITNSFDTIRVSLDGIGSSHDSICGVKGMYKKVINGLEELQNTKRKSKIGLNFVFSQHNKAEAKKITEQFERKVDFITFLPKFSFNQNPNVKCTQPSEKIKQLSKNLTKCRKSGNTKDFLNNPSLEYSKRICDAGRLYFSIGAKGGVSPCPFYKKVIVGNVNTASLIDLYPKMHNVDLRGCKGCYATCTTEVSRTFRMGFLRLLLNLSVIKRTFKV